MWKPVGPLPAAVYWRRRSAALGSVVTLAGVAVAIAAVPTPAPVPTVPPPVPVADRSSSGAPGPTIAAPAAEGARDTALPDILAGTVGSTPASTVPRSTSTTPMPTASATPTPSPNPPSGTERIHPDDTRHVAVAQTAAPVPATGPVPCTNAMLSAEAELDHAVHKVGSRPVFRLVITDVSGQPCVRDLDSARQEIVVWSADGTTRLWSSNDCGNASSIDLRTLVPGRPVAFAVTWAERTSSPGCRPPRAPVPAGTYRLMVRLDDLISPPTPFIRTP